MEYLTLQDIPHRHCEPLHSRNMTSSRSAESSLANMVAAVSHEPASSISIAAPSAISAPLVLEPALRAPSPALPGAFRASAYAPARGAKHAALPPPPPPHPHPPHPPLPLPHFDPLHHPLGPGHGVMHQYSQDTVLPRSLSFPSRQRSPSPLPRRHLSHYAPTTMMTTTAAATRGPNQTASLDSTNAHSPAGQQSSSQSSTSLTDVQNHHMRSSPPIQPGEQAFPGKLPSFSEVCVSPLFQAQNCATSDVGSFFTPPARPHLQGHRSAAMARQTAPLTHRPTLTRLHGPTASAGV